MSWLQKAPLNYLPVSVYHVSDVIVLRDPLRAKNLLDALTAAGISAQAFQAIDIKPCKPTQLPSLSHEAVLVTSVNAVLQGETLLADANWKDTVFIAVGEATAKVLAEKVSHVLLAKTPDSEGLLATLADVLPQAKRVALFTGRNGRGVIEQYLSRKNIVCDVVTVYERVPTQASFDDKLAAKLLVVPSVDVLMFALAAASPEYRECCKQIPLLCYSQRIADAATRLGFSSIHVSRSMDENCLVDKIKTLF